MATLTGNPIKDSYDGLIKTTDNAALSGTAKAITDGLGGATNLQMSTTSTNFVSGTVDFTGATVTGLPDVDTTYSISSVQDGANSDIKLEDQLGNSTKVTLVAGDNVTLTNTGNDVTIDAPDTNTTYDLAAVANGANINLNLTGSDATTDTVSIVAGTNITLSEAAGVVTIDAAGGGGAAGLVSGTGTDAMISSSTLTTTAAQSSATGGIALGNGAQANGNLGVALGNGAQASGDESLAIGDQTQATQIGSVAIGQYAEASGTYSSAWGRTSYARAEGSVAFGQQAGVLATEPGGVSMGRGVVAVNSDTTHVRALYIVAPNGGTGGNGITMLSPNGTAYTLTVSNAGALVIS